MRGLLKTGTLPKMTKSLFFPLTLCLFAACFPFQCKSGDFSAALFPFFSWGGTKWDPEQPRERKSLDFAFFLQLLLLVKSFWPASDGSRVEAEDGDAAGSRTRGGWERGCHGTPHQDKLLQLPSGQQSSVTLLLINSQLGDAFLIARIYFCI